MAKINKVICDKCKRELDYEEWYYSGNIVTTSASSDKGIQILEGDYCKKCFKETLKEKIGG